MLSLVPAGLDHPLRVLALAAHCDDVEIGAGATILRLLRDHPGAALRIVIASSDDAREAEARAAAAALGAASGASVDVFVAGLPENVLPAHTGTVRTLVLEHGRPFAPDLVLSPHLLDRHQDHRVMAESAHQLFRDHPIFEYEIAKFDGDLHTPNVYAPASVADATAKVDMLEAHYPSQHGRTWFDREAFFALMRIRGIECNAHYAEGFHCRKLTV